MAFGGRAQDAGICIICGRGLHFIGLIFVITMSWTRTGVFCVFWVYIICINVLSTNTVTT